MAFQITEQLRAFGWAILLGLAAGLLYDLLRAIRLRRTRITWALDLLYCLTAGAVPLRSAPGGRTAAGLHPPGRSGRRRGVFQPVFRPAAAPLGLLAGPLRRVFPPAGLAPAERFGNL